MRKTILSQQVGQLVMTHAPDKMPEFHSATATASAKAKRFTWMVAAGVLAVAAVASVVAFLTTMGDDLAEYGSKTLSDSVIFYVPGSVLPVAVLAVGLVMTNRRAFAHTLGQILAEHGVLDRVPQARQLLRAQPLKTLYQATWVVVTVVLVAFGALWAAMISAVTATTLSIAKDPKSM